jgi:hypothetical protein
MVLSSQETNLWCISKNGSPHGMGIMFFVKHSPNSGRKIWFTIVPSNYTK